MKYRPSTGGASKKPKKLALTTATLCSCVSSPTPTASVLRDTPAICENALDHLASHQQEVGEDDGTGPTDPSGDVLDRPAARTLEGALA